MFDFQQILTEVPQRALRAKLGGGYIANNGIYIHNFSSETHENLPGAIADGVRLLMHRRGDHSLQLSGNYSLAKHLASLPAVVG